MQFQLAPAPTCYAQGAGAKPHDLDKLRTRWKARPKKVRALYPNLSADLGRKPPKVEREMMKLA